MGFEASIDIAASGMAAQRQRLEVIATNLANAKTTKTETGGPYRKKLVIFRSQQLEQTQAGNFKSQLRRELSSVSVDDIIEDSQPSVQVFEPTHPDADESGYVLYPNVNPVDEMVNMLGAARSYESNLEVMKTVTRISNAALEIGKA